MKVQLKGKRARHVKIGDFKDLIKVLQDRKRIGEEEGHEYFLSIEIRSWVLDSGGDDSESIDEVNSDEESSASDGGIRPGVASPDSNSGSEFDDDDSSGIALQESASMHLTGDDFGKGNEMQLGEASASVDCQKRLANRFHSIHVSPSEEAGVDDCSPTGMASGAVGLSDSSQSAAPSAPGSKCKSAARSPQGSPAKACVIVLSPPP